MPPVLCTAFFKDDDGHGRSEAYAIDGGSGTPDLTSILNNFNNLMINYRRPLLAGDSFLLGCRVSYKAPNNVNAGDNIELDPPMRGPQTFSGISLGTGAPEMCVKMRFSNAGRTQKSDVYICFPWSQVVTNGVLDFGNTAGAEWKRRADILAAQLVGQKYGWIGSNPATTSRGTAGPYTQNTDGTVTMQVAATNGIALPPNGTRLPVKFARINGSKSIMNRVFTCVVAGGGAQLLTTEKITPSAYETAGTYIGTQGGLIQFALLSYYRLSKRATGRPFGQGRGRRPAQVLH